MSNQNCLPCALIHNKCFWIFHVYLKEMFLILLENTYTYVCIIYVQHAHTYKHTKACILCLDFLVSNTDLKSFNRFFPVLLAFYALLFYVFCNYVDIKVYDCHITWCTVIFAYMKYFPLPHIIHSLWILLCLIIKFLQFISFD